MPFIYVSNMQTILFAYFSIISNDSINIHEYANSIIAFIW